MHYSTDDPKQGKLPKLWNSVSHIVPIIYRHSAL
jgi:hypothetical protein